MGLFFYGYCCVDTVASLAGRAVNGLLFGLIRSSVMVGYRSPFDGRVTSPLNSAVIHYGSRYYALARNCNPEYEDRRMLSA